MTDPTQTKSGPGTTPATGQPTKTDPSTTSETPLGEAGKKALAAEREARKTLEKQLADQAKQLEGLAPLGKLAEVLGVTPEPGKTDVDTLRERVEAQERRAAEAEIRALRLEVAAEKGLTPAQAARLAGATREELAADADALKALFPAIVSTTPGMPAPDPTQGARGGVSDLQAQLVEAEKKGRAGVQDAIRIKQQMAALRVKK